MATEGRYDVPTMENVNGHALCLPYDTNEFRVHSFGRFSGENPFVFPFPILMLQIVFIMFLTRLAYYILRPLKTPRVVSDLLGGLILSPSILGRVRVEYTDDVGETGYASFIHFMYPIQDYPILRSIAGFGVMFYLFLVGVKINPKMIVQSGKKAWVIGAISFVVPFTFLSFLSYAFREYLFLVNPSSPFILFIIATLTLSTFPVLADILMELQLLNSEMGRLAMSVSMVHGLIGFVFMSAFVALNQIQNGDLAMQTAIAYLAGVVVITAFVFHPLLKLIIKRTPKGGRIGGAYIFSIFATMMFMAFISDSIGASFVFAPFIMGLAVPEGPPLGSALVEKAQLLAAEVLMPLIYAVYGMSTSFNFLPKLKIWVGTIVVLFVGHVLRALAAALPAIYCEIPKQNAITLGLMMNFSGIVEALTLLNLKNGGVLKDKTITAITLVMITVTGISVSLVKKYYSPLAMGYSTGRRTIQQLKSHAELRILVCVHSESPVPSMVNLLEASAPANEMPVCAYVLHLTQIEGRVISEIISHKNKKGYINPSGMDQLHNVFLSLGQSQTGLIAVQPYTSITPLNTMHQDICSLAAQKSVTLVVVPFLRKDAALLTDLDNAMHANIPTIQSQAPCTVGILVYPDVVTAINQNGQQFQHKVAVLFWGGPHDREALSYASRMVRKVGVTLSVYLFVTQGDRKETKDRKLDENLLAVVQYENATNSQLTIQEIEVNSVEQTIKAVRSIGNAGYDLTLVGKKQGENSLLDENMADWCDFPELGVAGDILASKDCEGNGSILVLEQQV